MLHRDSVLARATAVQDRATRGPWTSALPAVRGHLKSPNPRSPDVHTTRGPRSADVRATRGPRSCPPAKILSADVYTTILKCPRYPRSAVRGLPRLSAVRGRPRLLQ